MVRDEENRLSFAHVAAHEIQIMKGGGEIETTGGFIEHQH